MMKTTGLAAILLAGLAGLATAAPAVGQPRAPSAEADHLALHVADLDISIAFYHGAFGLAEIRAAVHGPRWMGLGGGMALHLIPGRTAAVANDHSVHLALRTRSLEPTLEYLRSNGIEWQDWAGKEAAVTRRDDGVHQIFLQDPDGYWLEVNDAGDAD